MLLTVAHKALAYISSSVVSRLVFTGFRSRGRNQKPKTLRSSENSVLISLTTPSAVAN